MPVSDMKETSGTKTGGVLGRDRAIVYGWIFLAAQLVLLGILALRSHGIIAGGRTDNTTDFMMLYASGKLALAGMPQAVYDLVRQTAIQQHIFGGPLDGIEPFFYPPIYLIVCVALAVLPYLAGYAIWVLATGALFLAVLTRIAGDWRVAVALTSFPPAIVNLGLGQNAFLTASLFGLGLILLERRPYLAGMAFGALAFKPHFLILVPLALLAGGYWRAILGAAAMALALSALSAVLFGAGVWVAFLAHVGDAAAIYGGSAHGYWAETSLYAASRLLGAGPALAGAIHGVAAIMAAACVIYGWWRGIGLAERAALLIAGTLVAMPINLSYDLLAVSVAVAFLIPAGLAAGERYVIAALFPLALVGRGVAERWGMPLLPLVALVLLALTLARLRRESSATESRRPGPGADYRRSRPSSP